MNLLRALVAALVTLVVTLPLSFVFAALTVRFPWIAAGWGLVAGGAILTSFALVGTAAGAWCWRRMRPRE